MRIITSIALAFLLSSCSRHAGFCQVCGREECKGFAFRITLQNGKTVETCCPRCGLEYLRTSKEPVRTLEVMNYASGQWMDATKAIYVSGSDVSHCAMKDVRHDAYGCCYYKGFDRCEPSLIAFVSQADAATFNKQHGGSIVEYDKLARP